MKENHTKNNLYKDLRELGAQNSKEVEHQIIEFILRHCEKNEAVLANNSVHFDERFLRAQMPHVLNVLHYRRLDVSSIRRGHRLFTGIDFKKPSASHRALDDCHTAIRELKELYIRLRECVKSNPDQDWSKNG